MSAFNENLEQDNNLGGNQSIAIIECNGSFSMAAAMKNSIAAASVNALTNLAAKHQFESLSFEQKSEETSDGTMYKISVKFFYAKINVTDSNYFDQKKEMGFLVKCQDNNNTSRLCGTTDNPMRLLADEMIDAKINGKNGYVISFYNESPSPALFII